MSHEPRATAKKGAVFMRQRLFYSLLMQMGEDVAHFILFRFQVEFVEFLGFHFDGDAFYDFDAEAFEAVAFADYTADREFHPALKIYVLFSSVMYYTR